MVVFENECKKTNTRSQTQKYLSLGKFTLAPLCEPHKIEIVQEKEYFPDIFHASSSVIADIFEACGIDLPDYVRILYYNDYMGDESIGRAAIEKIELAWQADPSKFRVDKKQNRLIYSYPPDGPWYELKYIADELPNSLEAEISGGNQLIMNYEQAQELFGIKFRRWLGIFNL